MAECASFFIAHKIRPLLVYCRAIVRTMRYSCFPKNGIGFRYIAGTPKNGIDNPLNKTLYSKG